MHGNMNVKFCQQLTFIYRQITQRLLNNNNNDIYINLASLIDHDSPQPDIHTLWIYEQFIPCIFSHLKLYMVEILSTIIYFISFHIVTVIIL